jgi:deaminated glutathione amidase
MKVAAVQLNSTADKQANLAAAERLVRAAASDDAALVVLPEKWTVLGTDEQMRAGAETLDGPSITWARGIAAELGLELIAGSIVERMPESDVLANTCVHIDPHGVVRAIYRKIHMFDVEVEEKVYRESELEQPGEEIVVSETADGRTLGLSICYDLRFPELYRILALEGAQLMPLPAAFTLATTRDHWQVLLRARAIENQVFVVAANQVGPHPGGYRSGGRSMIVDPWGLLLAQAQDAEGYAIAALDFERQSRIRRELPALANRRPRAYRWPEADTVGSGHPLHAAHSAEVRP